MEKQIVDFVQSLYRTQGDIPLHVPFLQGNEKQFLNDCLSSTFVSSVGNLVGEFEKGLMNVTNSQSVVATVNGTSALHLCLKLAGVEANDLVITQPVTFVATCNAISYCGAEPVFVDVDLNTLSLCPLALASWLDENAFIDEAGSCRSLADDRQIKACIVMHTFGHPADLEGILKVLYKWNLVLIEDAAEALGSYYAGQHVGNFGAASALSFNGNKVITTGGGGAVLSNAELGKKAKHLSTTAKINDEYEFVHDRVGYNYRMPNINAALGCAQLEQLDFILNNKRRVALLYKEFFKGTEYRFIDEPKNCTSNFWLNGIIVEDKIVRNNVLKYANNLGVQARPIWRLMNKLPMYRHCHAGNLANSEWLADRVINLPSSVVT